MGRWYVRRKDGTVVAYEREKAKAKAKGKEKEEARSAKECALDDAAAVGFSKDTRGPPWMTRDEAEALAVRGKGTVGLTSEQQEQVREKRQLALARSRCAFGCDAREGKAHTNACIAEFPLAGCAARRRCRSGPAALSERRRASRGWGSVRTAAGAASGAALSEWVQKALNDGTLRPGTVWKTQLKAAYAVSGLAQRMCKKGGTTALGARFCVITGAKCSGKGEWNRALRRRRGGAALPAGGG
eukprot:gene51028-39776_t